MNTRNRVKRLTTAGKDQVALFFSAVVFCVLSNAAPALAAAPVALGQGQMAGRVTENTAILQSRLTRGTELVDGDLPGSPGTARFELATDPEFKKSRKTPWIEASPDRDYIVKAPVTGLRPATRHYWRVLYGPDRHHIAEGRTCSFKTLGGFRYGSCRGISKTSAMIKYWDRLFADPILVNTPKGKITVYPQRTNNIMERFFRDFKRGDRKKTGNISVNRMLQAMLADTSLVRNLKNPEYLDILLDGCPNLEQRFARITLDDLEGLGLFSGYFKGLGNVRNRAVPVVVAQGKDEQLSGFLRGGECLFGGRGLYFLQLLGRDGRGCRFGGEPAEGCDNCQYEQNLAVHFSSFRWRKDLGFDAG
jgi:hypothetical protein